MRAVAVSLCLFAVAGGCSPPPQRATRVTRLSAGAGAANGGTSGATTSDAPVGGDGNATQVLLPVPPPPPPVAGTKADLPFAACEVGKFCTVQTRGEDDCGTLSLTHDETPSHLPGNLLILFDQSLSMDDAWGSTGQSKLQAAQMAIANAIAGLKDSLNVGAFFFPTQSCSARRPSPPGGAVAPIDSAPQIPFSPGPQFLVSWAQHWQSGTRGGFGTPLQEAFDRADSALAATKFDGALAVIAVTDGEPNCVPDSKTSAIPTSPPADRAQSWLSARQVKTYVLGLPGAAGVQLLNNIAANGGTMQYLLPDDPVVLEAQLKQVVQDTILTRFQSCSIDLDPPTVKPAGLQMLVVEASNGMKHHIAQQVDKGSGWSVSADGGHVEIVGQLCTDAQTGRFRAITFEYPCDPSTTPPGQKQIPQ